MSGERQSLALHQVYASFKHHRQQVPAVITDKPQDFLERHVQALQRVSVDDLARGARQYMDIRDSLVVFVPGNPDNLAVQLDSLRLGAPVELEPVLYRE